MPLFVVTRGPGENWTKGLDMRDQEGWEAHQRFMSGLHERGVVICGGILGHKGGADGDVMLVMRDAGAEAARRTLGSDPWVRDDILPVRDVSEWHLQQKTPGLDPESE